MMRHYATLCDATYLPRALVLYRSLLQHSSKDFTLYVLPMDEESERMLTAMALPQLEVIRRKPFEALMQMETIKANRSFTEYCWTCGSNFAYYLLLRANLDLPAITYLDADMMFFGDPEIVFQETGHRSIAIIPHRLIPSKKYLEVNGLYNVSWVTFRNTEHGRECLATWAEQCRAWCYNRNEGDRFGDQLYLNDWPRKYGDDLRVIEHIGAGLAPWNLANYGLQQKDVLFVSPDGHRSEKRVIFFHYHEFDDHEDGTFRLTNYDLRPEDVALIYAPYLEAYRSAKAQIERLHVSA